MNALLPVAHHRTLRSGLVDVMPSLRAHALRLAAGRRDEADELVQDTLERALRFEATYEPDTNLRAWAHQILFSVFITRCRRRRRERRALESLTSDPCAWTRKDAQPEMRLLTPRVERALEALPHQFAAVVRLVDLGELSYKEAATRLSVPLGTVMSRLFRGRKLLAVALGESAAASAAPPLATAYAA